MRVSTRIAHAPLLLLLLASPAPAQRPEIVPQAGHAAPIFAFAFSGDGRVCATGDNRGIVKVWDTRGGRLLRTIQAHAWLVSEIALSADGRTLASAGQINGEKRAPVTVKLWSVAGGKMLFELEAAPFAFSPDGRVFAAGVGKEIKLWDARDGRPLRTLAGHKLRVAALSYSPDGRLIGSSGGEEEEPPPTLDAAGNLVEPQQKAEDATPLEDRAKVWDAQSGKLSAELEGCTEARFSPDGTLVADAAGNVCETKTGKLLQGRKHSEFVTFGPDGGTVVLWENVHGPFVRTAPGAAPRAPARLVVLEARGGNLLHRFDGYEHNSFYDPRRNAYTTAYAAAYSPDGRVLVVSGEKRVGETTRNFFAAWDARAWRPLYERDGYSVGPFSPDGKYLKASRPEGAESFVFELLEAVSGRTVARLSASKNSDAEAHFSPDGGTIAWVEGIALSFRDADGGRPRSVSQSDDVAAVVFSPDGKRFAVSKGVYDTGNQRYELWETGSGGLTYSFAADAPRPVVGEPGDETAAATEMAYNLEVIGFSPDGGLLATGDTRLRDVQSGAVVRKFAGGVAPGTRLHAVLTGGAVELRDARTNRLLRRIATPNASRVALSPDERLVAVGFWADAEVTLRLYDAASGRLLRNLEDVTPWVVYLAFSPDSRLLAVSTQAGSGGYTDNSIFDARTGRLLTNFFDDDTDADDEQVASNKSSLLAVSTDGKYALLQGDQVAGVELREAATGKLVKALPQVAPHGAVCAAFSPDGKIIATGDFDTAVRFWSIETGELLATVLSFEGGDWLALTPDGLFDGSPAAWGRMLWRFSEDIFDVAPAELFFNEFYHPGLLADVLAGRRPRAAADIARKDRRQPVVTLKLEGAQTAPPSSSNAREVELRVEVTDAAPDRDNPQGSGARDVRLFRNGSLVKVWLGDVLKGQPSTVLDASVPLVAGENRLVAYAFNRDNVKSADAALTVRGDETLRRKGTVYVIAVGVNEYANPQFNLKYAVADAEAFGEQIKSEQERLGHYARVEVAPLYDAGATKANILRALGGLASKVQPEDAVVVFFAGHGTAHENSFYLLPHDLGYAGRRSSLDPAGLEKMLAHGVSDRELEEAFQQVDAGQILFVIDACNSGQALEAEEKRRGPMNSKGLAQLAYEKGMYILTAAQSYQAAQEVSQLGHGLLTYALVEEGLRQGAGDRAPRDGNVFAREWLDYAAARVPEIQIVEMKRARELGVNLSFADEERDLELARRNGQRPRVFYRRELEARPLVIAARTTGGQTRESTTPRRTPRNVRPRRRS